jgi:hypothetical protein
LAILIGVKTRWIACAFVIWLILVTVLGHPFWTMEGAARGANQANFYKNLAIKAAYLLLAITGAGRYSLDHRPALAPSKAAAPVLALLNSSRCTSRLKLGSVSDQFGGEARRPRPGLCELLGQPRRGD